ncbi:MAG TPA: metallophosphoesterase [Clostridiaceae bacterium]|nr:metallophosphoesterase [Clostridiaceae bacterium]
MKQRKKAARKPVYLILLFLILILIVHTIWSNVTVGITHYNVQSSRIPSAFNQYKIAQVSDLHNAEFGKENSKLLNLLSNEKPNIIAITGDLVDANHTNIKVALDFIEKATKIAPCYFVTGNHEAWIGDQYTTLKSSLESMGVNILENEKIILEEQGAKISLIGLEDPDTVDRDESVQTFILDEALEPFAEDESYKILLSHRPEQFEVYVKHKVDLVLSGHAHGGQVRIPFAGGLVAPNQGFFPKYDSGLYVNGSTNMIVSRGLGNSIIPIRINNRPELVIITLENLDL